MSDGAKNSIEDMKANLLATMSHEMRTPMQSVFGFLELMMYENPSDKMRGMIESAMVSASGVLEILDDILDVVKIDADKMILDRFDVPVRTLVKGALEALESKVAHKPIMLIDEVAADVPRLVTGDPKRLRQILINLVGNAIKFTPEGSVTIRVGVRIANAPVLRFEVVDTGIGLSKEVCQKLFEPFMQADSSTSREFGGTGLGLSISRKLVALMGGQIGVDSVQGQGAVFWFEIPMVEVQSDVSSGDLPDLVGLSILSVEDHPQAAREIVSSLSSMGAVVESVPSVTEAQRMISYRPYDVVICDQSLEDGEGLPLIRYLAENRPQTGLIMYTARDDLGLRQSLQSLGALYLEKPASRRGLGEAVTQVAIRQYTPQPNGSGKVLLVEDTESVRDMFFRQFEVLGVDVTFATDGVDALDILEHDQFQLVITDLHMPKMDGYGLIKKIRAQDTSQKRMPVVLLTADIQMSGYRTYMPLGFDECLLKPVSLGALRQLLVRWSIPVVQPSAARIETVRDEEEFTSLDLEQISAQMGGIDASVCGMLSRFPDMMRPLMDKMLKACADQDIGALRELSHSLKGAARSAGAMILGDLAETIQKAAEEGRCDDAGCAAFAEEFERVLVEIGRLSYLYQT